MSQNPSIQTKLTVDTPIILTQQSFPTQNYLSISEKIRCQTSQLETAHKHIRGTESPRFKAQMRILNKRDD